MIAHKLTTQEIIDNHMMAGTPYDLKKARVNETIRLTLREISSDQNATDNLSKMIRYYDNKAQLAYNIIVGFHSDNPLEESNRPRFFRKYMKAQEMAHHLRGVQPLSSLFS